MLAANAASAQNWDFDARTIGLGGVSGSGTLASGMIEHDAPYQSIVLPFGLLQVLPDLDVYDPDSANFDPVRAVEHAASPIHFIVGRDDAAGDGRFAATIATARFYADRAGTAPVAAARIDLGGVVTATWGGAISVSPANARDMHGIYVGAGPYVTVRGATAVDPQLIGVLGGTGAIPQSSLTVLTAQSEEQVAVAVSGGYRGRFASRSAAAGSRDGIYVAVNYNYLIGVEYVDDDMAVRLNPANLVLSRISAGHGRGRAVDAGVGLVVDRWEFGAGANGLGNRITWSGATSRTIAFGNVLAGGSGGNGGVAVAHPDVEVSLPVDVRGNVTYRADRWLAVGEAGHGVAGTVAHVGAERHVRRAIDLRGGLSYSYGDWNPTGGVGIAFSRRVSFDVAAFGTSANFERTRKLALAASIRVQTVR
jgi:hypothetical protein